MDPHLFVGPKVIQGRFPGGRPTIIQPKPDPSHAPMVAHVQEAIHRGAPAFYRHVAQRKAIQEARSQTGTARLLGMSNATRLPVTFHFAPSIGQPMPPQVQHKMEAFFGADFSDVRVHVGPQAQQIGAQAFTTGRDIYFAPGQYMPHHSHGQRLLGHELAHVVQQRSGRVRNPFGLGMAVVQDPGLEAEADRMGLRAASFKVPVQAKMGNTVRASTANTAASSFVFTPQPEPSRGEIPRNEANQVVQPMKFFLSGLFGSGDRKDNEEERRRKQLAQQKQFMKEQLKELERKYPNITIIWNSLSVPLTDLKNYIFEYLSGNLLLYRGVQQCALTFPMSDYESLVPKVPNSNKPPDFASNNNSWCPMSPNKKLCFSIALSWSQSIAGYFKSRGGMDADRPVALIYEYKVKKTDKIAFCFDDEIQVKGPFRATKVHKVMIDEDWGKYNRAYTGLTFRQMAIASKLNIKERSAKPRILTS